MALRQKLAFVGILMGKILFADRITLRLHYRYNLGIRKLNTIMIGVIFFSGCFAGSEPCHAEINSYLNLARPLGGF